MKRTVRHSSMRKAVAVLGILAVFLQLNALAVMYMLYYANQSSLVEAVCERKSPDCLAKCYVAKQVASHEEHKSESSSDKSSVSFAPVVAEYLHEESAALAALPSKSVSNVIQADVPLSAGVTHQVFNPPRA